MNRVGRATSMAISVFALASIARAGRPLTIDDAEPIDRGTWQVEYGVAVADDGGRTSFAMPATIAYGLRPNLEVGAGLSGLFGVGEGPPDGTASGLSDVVIDAKYRYFQSADAAIELAIAPSLQLPIDGARRDLSSGDVDADLTLLATCNFGKSAAIDVNLGYTLAVVRHDDPTIVHYGIAGRRQVSEQWWIVGEVFADTPASDATSVSANVGVQYAPSEYVVFDAAVGCGIHDAPDVTATIGVTLNF